MAIAQVDRGRGPALAWARGAGAAVGAEVSGVFFWESDPIFGMHNIR